VQSQIVQIVKMVQVNPANILNMLIIFFQISKIPETPVNDREIKLRNMTKDITQSSMNEMSLDIETDTTLEFENYWESQFFEADFIADNKMEKLEENENNNQAEDSCISEEWEMISDGYKRRAFEFWKSVKRVRYSFSTVK
jgi:hypothetical protein